MARSSLALLCSIALAAPAAAQTGSPVAIRFAQQVVRLTPAATLAR